MGMTWGWMGAQGTSHGAGGAGTAREPSRPSSQGVSGVPVMGQPPAQLPRRQGVMCRLGWGGSSRALGRLSCQAMPLSQPLLVPGCGERGQEHPWPGWRHAGHSSHGCSAPDSAGEHREKLTPPSRDKSAPWHPSVPSVSLRELPKHCGLPALHSINPASLCLKRGQSVQ